MDYFIVCLLVIIIFTFLSDKKVMTKNEIMNIIKDIDNKIDKIYKELLIININDLKKDKIKDLKSEDIFKYIKEQLKNNSNKKYVLIVLKEINLTNNDIKLVVANYILNDKKSSGFIPRYEYRYINYKSMYDLKQELKVASINYINIFSKAKIDVYGIIITTTSKLEYILKNDISKEITTFASSEHLKIYCNKLNTNNLLKKIEKIYEADIKAILKSILLIIVGVTVTTNIINAIYNLELINILISVIMYWCYNIVLKYMYSPIGKYKLISKYLFPIFITWYLIIFLFNKVKKSSFKNKKVHAS